MPWHWASVALGAVLGALITLAVVAWRSQQLRRRIERLRRGIEDDEPALEDASDPVGRLAAAIRKLHADVHAAKLQRELMTAQLDKRADAMASLVSEMDQLAYAASHDLLTPLRGIEQLVGFIGEDLRDTASAETREHLQLLRSRVHRMSMLLASIREYTQVSATDVEISRVEVAEVIRSIVADLRVPEGFTLRTPEHAPSIDTAEAGLKRVLQILIANAVRHHDRAPGVIEVTVTAPDPRMFEFAITDDGPGIPKSDHRRVFLMFRTLQRRDERETAGMGLPLAKKIVETAGGTIVLESPVDGTRGTRMRFTWPRIWAGGPNTVLRMFKASKSARRAG